MGDSKRNDPEWRRAARDVGSAVGGGARRFARGLADLTRRPDDDPPAEEAPDASAGTGDDDDLGERMKELGRDFVDVMGKVSVTAGKKIRRAAWVAADTVRDTVKKTDD